MSPSNEQIKDIFQKILSNSHSEYDLDRFISLIRYDKLDSLRESIIVTGSNNNIQIGDNNSSTPNLRIDDIQYQQQELKVIVDTLNEYLQEIRNSNLQSGFKGLCTNNFLPETTIIQKISYRHLTGLNEYSTLSLVEEEIPIKLRTILSIEKAPILYTDSPVIENIKNFQKETGNQFLISYLSKFMGLGYVINNHGQTHYTDRPIWASSDNPSSDAHKILYQSKEDFENDMLSYTPEYSFEYSPVYSDFQDTDQDSQWTSIVKPAAYSENYDGGMIFQFPKLSNVYSMRFSSLSQGSDESIDFRGYDYWIHRIIETNPDVRGLLLFGIPYMMDISKDKYDFYFGGGCGDIDPSSSHPIERICPTPYVRFVDICNISKQSIKIKSISFQVSQKSNYTLTELGLGSRGQEVSSGNKLTQEINISLDPQSNIIIPIEFGFDTKTYEKHFSYRSYNQYTTPDEISENEIYIFKMPDGDSMFDYFVSSLRSKKMSIQEIPSQERNSLVSEKTKLSNEFLAKNKTINELIKQVPRRFAVGTFMDVISVNVDDQEIEIEKPDETPKFEMTMNFGYGCCPYLMVYKSNKNYWKELGPILYARKCRDLQASEVFNLGDDISKFRIEEREQEVTFIKSLSIIYYDLQKNEKEEVSVILSKIEPEGEYYLLRQGECIEIDLHDLIPLHSSDIQLNINGYYTLTQSSNIQE